jgi:hypothetical protein
VPSCSSPPKRGSYHLTSNVPRVSRVKNSCAWRRRSQKWSRLRQSSMSRSLSGWAYPKKNTVPEPPAMRLPQTECVRTRSCQ